MRLALASLMAAGLWAATPKAPDWLNEAATATLPAYNAKVPAAVLMNQESVTVEDASRKVHSVRFAVKILNREGAKEAAQGISYFAGAAKIRDTKAWLIMPSGKVKEYGKNDVVDANMVTGVYDEYRYQTINASRDADPGAIFGFESTLEEKTVFSQFTFDFQEDLPSLRSAFTLNLPPGWKAEGKLLGGGEIKTEQSGNTYRWQLASLPPYEREPNSPARTSLNPRLVVSTYPSEGTPGGHFATWPEVSSWTSQLVDPSAAVTPEIEAKVKSLTANAPGFWEKVQALADDAQKVRYISIQMNLARGGGYTPHPARDVLRNSYGDCKDKANYLRALLKAVGIDSYLVTIYSGDPRHTKREWPSPEQFNHAILAIKVPDHTKRPAAFDFPGLGRMMLFDPTNEVVPLGYIPDYEQNALALLLAGDKGNLFQAPATAPAANLLKRTVHLKLAADGSLSSATLQDDSIGQAAFDFMSAYHRLGSADFKKRYEGRLGTSMTGAMLAKIDPKEDPARQSFQLNLEFTAPAYGKMMQGRLMMLKAVVLPFGGIPDVLPSKRTHPLVVEQAAFEEHVEIELPPGFSVDELPNSGSLDSPYGKYSVAWKAENGKVTFERHLELADALVPASEYKAAREFFGTVLGAEQAPVVLVRK